MKSKTIKLNRSRKARTLRSNRRSGEAKLATKTRANSLSAFAKEVIIHFLEKCQFSAIPTPITIHIIV
jgi:hypothetical protein